MLGTKGRGVFSSVLLAVDEEAGPPGAESVDSDKGKGREVAIKVLRGNDLMLRAGLKEAALLRELMGANEEREEVGGGGCVWIWGLIMVDRGVGREKRGLVPSSTLSNAQRTLLARSSQSQQDAALAVGRRHVVCLFNSFKLGEHVCLVMEAMAMNLRKVLQTYGAKQGIAVKAVSEPVDGCGWLMKRSAPRTQTHPPTPPTHPPTQKKTKQVLSYTKQLLAGLDFLARKGIVHADLKPDNVVVSQNLAVLKVGGWIGVVSCAGGGW